MVREGSKKLPRSFYNRPTLDVAREVLGANLVYHSPVGRLSARIVEVEAYVGRDDPACHAARGLTKRNAVMFGKGGFSYIYFIYGMYYCFNIVTEQRGFPAAVLVRAAEPVGGVDHLLTNDRNRQRHAALSGPGKLCRGFGLTSDQSGCDLTASGLYLRSGKPPDRIVQTTRIGIKVGTDLPWRFYDADSPAVSRPR